MAMGDKGVTLDGLKASHDNLDGKITDLKSDLQSTDGNKAPVITNTASGSVASFSDGADDYPVKDLVVDIEPVQSGSGDPSPDNVRPITGWTGANVTRTGKNLWDEEWEAGTLNASTGEEISSDATMRSKNFIRIKPGMNCIAVGPYNVITTNAFIICYYDKDGVYIGYNTLSRPESFVVPSDERIALMRFAYRYYLNDSGGTYNRDVSVNYPSTATSYEPYNGDTYNVTFPTEAGTVYGGTLDVTTGVLTVDRKLYTFTGNEQFGLVTSTRNFFRWYSQSFANTIPDWKTPNAIKLSNYPASIKPYWDSGADTNKSAWTVSSTAGVCFRNDDYSTASEFAASLAGQSMLYELATPTTYQCTPQEVKTLLGANNIFADTADVDVEYYADTKKYIDNKIAELQALILENT